MIVVRASLLCALALLTACTKEWDPPRFKYDGAVATALSSLAKDCVPIGIAVGQPLAKASDFRCTAPDAEVAIHLDKQRTLRTVRIKLVAASTDEARNRFVQALAPVMDEHHRTHVFTHLDDPMPDNLMNPIPQLELEGFLYQAASEPVGDRRRYVLNVRVD